VSYIFDLSIIGRNAMRGVMEWCSKANHEIPNSKHQISGFLVSGVSVQVSGKINPNT